MASLRRLPPGRSGRLWLRHRRQVAARSVGLLDRKLRILRSEQERARLTQARRQQEWELAARQARVWTGRALTLGGQRDMRLSTPAEPATVEVGWGGVMGLAFPVRARCEFPAGSLADRLPGNLALGQAIAAQRRAVETAVAQAVATAACHAIDEEVAEVKRRLGALRQRWLPLLEQAARELESRLEETERSELSRLRAVQKGASE